MKKKGDVYQVPHGVLIISSSGNGGLTAIPGFASYTKTGLDFRGESATSMNDLNTFTRIVGNDPQGDTTHFNVD